MAQDPYDLDSKFERAVVTLACSNPRFYSVLGHAIDPDLLDLPPATVAMQAAHSIKAETGKGPSSCSTVLQRLRTWNLEGRVEYRTLEQVSDLFDDAEDAGLPDADEAIVELRPVIQQRAGEEAVRQAIKSESVGDFETVGEAFTKVSRIGFQDTDVGTIFRPRDFSAIHAINRGERLSFGFADLDRVTGGGLMRGMAGLMAAASGGGKTTFFSHVGREHWQKTGNVAYATLELAVGQIEGKFRAGATGIGLNDVLTREDSQRDCAEKIAAMDERGELGFLAIKKFTARTTMWEDIVAWHKSLAEFCGGKPPELLLVDFLGKLGFKEKGKSSYEAQGVIMDRMHEYAEDQNIWLWTGSQPQRGKKERKIIGNDDLNDSQGKIEGADLFISANKREEGRELFWWCGKNRAGPSEQGCGPFPHDFSFGRIVSPTYAGEPETEQTRLMNNDPAWDNVLGR